MPIAQAILDARWRGRTRSRGGLEVRTMTSVAAARVGPSVRTALVEWLVGQSDNAALGFRATSA